MTAVMLLSATAVMADAKKMLYSKTISTTSDVSWSVTGNNGNAKMESSYYVLQNKDTNSDRTAGMNVSLDTTPEGTYYIEMDLGLKGDGKTGKFQFFVTTEGTPATYFGSNGENRNKLVDNGDGSMTNNLFSIYASDDSPTKFYANATSGAELSMDISKKYHLKLTVNTTTVDWEMTQKDDATKTFSGSRDITGTHVLTGFGVYLGKNYSSNLYINNIEVYELSALTLTVPTITKRFVNTSDDTWQMAYCFKSIPSVGTPDITYNYTFTPTEGAAINGTGAYYTPTTTGTLSVTASATDYVTSDAAAKNDCENLGSTEYAHVASFDLTNFDAFNDKGSAKGANDAMPGFTNGTQRYQISGNATDNTFVQGLRFNSGYFNIYEGYGMNYNTAGSTASMYYKRDANSTQKMELKYKTGNTETPVAWNSVADYSYDVVDYTANDGLKVGLTNNKIVSAIDVYEPLASAKVSVTIGEAGYATFSAPCALNFGGISGLTAYTTTVNGDYVALNPVNNVPAETGVILEGTAGTYTIPAIASSETAQGDLTATLWRTVPAAGNNFVLSKESGVVGFYKLPDNGAVQACRAYLTVPATARTFFGFSDEATGINENRIAINADNRYYSISGQQVANPTKGLYIVNGKKVIIK